MKVVTRSTACDQRHILYLAMVRQENSWTCLTDTIIGQATSTLSYVLPTIVPYVAVFLVPTDPTGAQIAADGYKSITTQIFDRETPYLDNDSVFAVKDGLTVDFTPRKGDAEADWQLDYDISMAPLGSQGVGSVPLAPTGAIA